MSEIIVMPDKKTSISSAIKFINDGDLVALGGMNLYRRPMAAVCEIIRNGFKHLTLLSLTSGLEADILIGAGCVKTIRSCYVGLESFGLAPNFTNKATAGEIEVIEETEATIAFGLRAALAKVGFLPARVLIGTDTLKVRRDIKMVRCPYSDEEYPAIPALKPDVAIIHSQISDSAGYACLEGEFAVDKELSLASRKVILTTEKIVTQEEIESRGADIIGISVDAVVEVPSGAQPTSCYPNYPLDGEEILRYLEMCNKGKFQAYLDNFLTRKKIS